MYGKENVRKNVMRWKEERMDKRKNKSERYSRQS